MMLAATNSDRRILQLDGLRGIAFLAVFVHHALDIPLLWVGVDIFFVLSGFLITGVLMNHQNESIGSYFGLFYARRLQRIWPPYLLFLVLLTLVFGPSWLREAHYYLFGMNVMEARGVSYFMGSQPPQGIAYPLGAC